MSISSYLTEPAKMPRPAAYGFLVFLLILFATAIRLWFSLPPRYPYDPYGNLVCITMLLLNHLAFNFQYPRPVTIAFRLLAMGWLIFGIFYVFYWDGFSIPSTRSEPVVPVSDMKI